MSGAPANQAPVCPACADPAAAWEIISPVVAQDRVRFDATGLTELGLSVPDGGIEPLGRPVVRCPVCGTTANAEIGDAVLRAVVAAGPHRTPGDA